ncbi:MAG: putative endonuclease [Parcubacteria group bacterium Athens0714_25]|nr:MAG: putative endonuclease [Parcubacteria group bacterium Athens0714_25]
MYYVYILYSEKLKKRYIGYCSDLGRRIKDHNERRVVFTSRGVPWKIIYYEVFGSKSDAQREEKFLKTGKGRDRIKFLLEDTMKKINGRILGSSE